MERRTSGTVRRHVLDWYRVAHRDFPWRATHDPYAVLVSEVMLQQTQAGRVTDRWRRFMARFPTATALAEAPSASVLAEWSGLGYNRRALSLQRTAAIVARDGWPLDVAGLERLPGVGPYTARAVASLSFGQPVGAVDTNVRRWLLRRFRVEDRPRDLQEVADRLAGPAADADEAAAWTHATMEFGAAICTTRRPRCAECPIAAGCPSRDAARRVPVARQRAYRASDRAYRGAVLRLLAGANRHELADNEVRNAMGAEASIGPALDAAGIERIVAALERDGLVHRRAGQLRLGAARIGS